MENENITENVYKTVCPGCNIGCGVYIRKLQYSSNVNKLSIDYRKSDPINEGKLCSFGVCLPEYYSLSNSVDIKSNQINSIHKIVEVLNTYKPQEIEFVNIGNTTNEEHLAFIDLANVVNCSVNVGMSSIYKTLNGLHGLTKPCISYDDICNFKNIYIFCDLSVQYPLMIRNILKAKRNGSNIISFGVKKQFYGSKHIFLNPFDSIYSIEKLNFDCETLVIYDINQYVNIKRLAELIEIANMNNSKTLFLKPFVNSTGVGYLSKHTKQKSISEILELINKGITKVLICLETDIIGLDLDSKSIETLKKLEELIVISSRNTQTSSIATVLLQIDPFYKRHGTVINSENRIISQYVMTNYKLKENNCFDLIESIIENICGKKKTFEEVEKQLFEILNVDIVEKYKEPIINAKCTEKHEIKKISETIENQKFYSENNDMLKHIYIFSPYYWSCIEKYQDFVEINMEQVKSSNLLKNHSIDINCSCKNSRLTSKYKISDIMNGYIVSWNKKIFSKNTISLVSIEKTKT